MREARTYEEFMTHARVEDPERVALVEYKFPVLTERQLRRRSEDLEVPFSQLPESAFIGGRPVAPSSILSSDTVRLGRAHRLPLAGSRI